MRKKVVYILASLGVVLVGLFGLAATAPDAIFSFAPAAIRDRLPEDASRQIAWRVQFVLRKATGGVPLLSWTEVMSGLKPGGFLSVGVMEGRSLEASIINPATSPADVSLGKEIFEQTCAACHGTGGSGGHAPSLTKANYSVGSSDFSLYKVLRDGIAGTAMASLPISEEQRWQVVAYLRTLSGRGTAKDVAGNHAPDLDVKWEHLLDARSRTSEWLTYSGALDGQRHSSLKEINVENVGHLRLLWAHQLDGEKGMMSASPIIAGGVIFIPVPPNKVLAVDASSGRELWKYEQDIPDSLPLCCGRVNRGLAVLGSTVYLGTLDARLVALDASSGEVKWQTSVAKADDGFSITGAPLIVNDLVVVGISGGEFGVRGFLAAFDATTGQERWRFNTIPGPGETGHETWENDAWKTGGGPTWITGSYDPSLGLLYWGVGNPAPNYAGDLRPGDNLFTNSVIALNARTGELVWHFQFTPHDEHDWDSNQTPVLADLVIDSKLRHTILWANRNGFYYVLDRGTGEFLKGVPFVPVTWASGLDKAGRPIKTEAAIVTTTGTLTSPWVGGGVNWQPPSYDPQSGTFMVHATEGSSVYTNSPVEEVKRGHGGIYVGSGSTGAETAVKIVKGLDAATGAVKWEHHSPDQEPGDDSYSGVLSTAGGLAFSVSGGMLFALDSSTGEELWRSGLGASTKATPATFLLDGRQVLTVAAGRTLFMFGL